MIGKDRVAVIVALLIRGSTGPAMPVTLDTEAGPVNLIEAPAGAVAKGVTWRAGAGGLEWTDLKLHGRGEARRTRIVSARLDPARFQISLENGMAPGGFMAVWTLDAAPEAAVLAVNAGMFGSDGAWGWVVHSGREYRAPRNGPLAATIMIDSSGQVEFLTDAGMARVREFEMGRVREAFQSYPMLLRDGIIPELLQRPSDLIDLSHRDARLALGIDAEGKIVVALTRFDAMGPALGSVPFGLTLPEMAMVMRGLGAVSAVSLDGGISAQLQLRDQDGVRHRWAGLRAVPLGLSATPR